MCAEFRIEEYGAWIRPGVFEFFDPQDLGAGETVKIIDTAEFSATGSGATPEMVVQAILHGGGPDIIAP